MSEKVAFLGLGVMGGNMAARLVRAGHEVTVWNRTESKASAFVAAHGGRAARDPVAAVSGASFVCSCVGNDDHVRAVALGPSGALAGMQEGATYIDHSTVSAELARELATEASARGLHALDAPVSGGQHGAEQGTLSVMVGGERAAFERAAVVFAAYAKQTRLIGPAGSGQLAKMVNQICIAGLVEALAEGLHFAQSAGLDAREVVAAISGGAAQSWQLDHRHQTMLDGHYDFGFAVDWMRKDLGLALAEARRNGARLPVTALVDQFYAEVQGMGGARWDTSSLLARLKS
jgi:3-hydroxyisobutyrate dehydrogenase-like beta-hydroxyacid dehydrogenase